ncbi:MAG: hypothetical protein U0894_13935 [Pirellulales bacterium]
MSKPAPKPSLLQQKLDMELVNRVDLPIPAGAMNGRPSGPPPGIGIPSGNTVHRLPSGTMVIKENSGLGCKILPANSGLGDVKSIVLTGEVRRTRREHRLISGPSNFV